MRFLAHIRLLTSALMLLAIAVCAPAIAQKLGPDGAPNPTARMARPSDSSSSVAT